MRQKNTIAALSTEMLEEVVNKQEYQDTEEMTQWKNVSHECIGALWKELCGQMTEVFETYKGQQNKKGGDVWLCGERANPPPKVQRVSRVQAVLLALHVQVLRFQYSRPVELSCAFICSPGFCIHWKLCFAPCFFLDSLTMGSKDIVLPFLHIKTSSTNRENNRGEKEVSRGSGIAERRKRRKNSGSEREDCWARTFFDQRILFPVKQRNAGGAKRGRGGKPAAEGRNYEGECATNVGQRQNGCTRPLVG